MGDLTQDTPIFRRVTLTLFAGGLATYASLYTTQPLLPLLSASFHITPAMASLSVSAATAGLAVALVIAGPLADSLGRKSVMAFSLVATALAGEVPDAQRLLHVHKGPLQPWRGPCNPFPGIVVITS